MTKSKKLRRWDVVDKRELSLATFTLGRTKAGEVRLEFLANGVCGSDNHMFHTGAVHSGHSGPHQPLTLGHELIARVTKTGSKVKDLEVGDIVAVEPGLPCGECANCLKGRYHCCPHTLYMGTPPQNGGLADEFHWPAKWCHKLPDELARDVELASLVEPLGACLQSIDLRNKNVPNRDDDEWTIITGTGAMALGVLALTKALYPDEKVMVIARSADKLEFAESIGADATLVLSQVNPTAIAAAVKEELEALIATDHFDQCTADDFKSADTKAGKRAMDKALEAVRKYRERGDEVASILPEIEKAAFMAASEVLVEENTAIFKEAQAIAGGFISSAYECTGDEKLLVTLINSRCMLANGGIIGLGCHYAVSFDIAMLRRFELSFQPVRRSRNQFPPTLKLLADNPDYFRRLIGGVVKFDDFGAFMAGEIEQTETGTGGPKTVVIR